MTRLLIISRCPAWPLHLGDRLILYHLLEELSYDDSLEVDLLAFAERPTDAAEVSHYDHFAHSVELIPATTRSKPSLLWRALYAPARFPRRADQSWSPAMWGAIERKRATQTYDAVHLFGGVQVYEFYHALGGLPTIITPYESFSLYLSREAARYPPLAMSRQLSAISQLALARRYESFMFTPYQRVTVVAEPDADVLRSLNPRLQVEVIPNGVDTYQFRPRPVKRIPALLFVGNYEYAPNVDAALRLAGDIYPQLRAQYPNLRLWLVGNAPPPELQALASDSIRVTGRVPDVRPYLARAAAFVCPLQLGAGIKNKVLEALAMGCPVIATPLSVDGIAVTPGVHALVAEGDELITATRRLLSDPALAESLGAQGRALIEAQYSWAGVAARYRALYTEVIAAG